MNARTALTFAVLAAVSLATGCAVPTGESVGESESDMVGSPAPIIPAPVLPGPVVCDSTANHCSFTATGHYMSEFDSSFNCSQIYAFTGDQVVTRYVDGVPQTTTTHVYSYSVAYCVSSTALSSWVAARSGGSPLAVDAAKFTQPIYASTTSSQRDLPPAAAGYTYVRYFNIKDIGCKGGCPSGST